MTERQLLGAVKAVKKRERRQRADFIEDVGMAVWGGSAADRRVKALRKD